MLLIAGRGHIESGVMGSLKSAQNALAAATDEFEAITEVSIESPEGATMIFAPLFQAYERLAHAELKSLNDSRLERVRAELDEWLLTPTGKETVMMEAVDIQTAYERS